MLVEDHIRTRELVYVRRADKRVPISTKVVPAERVSLITNMKTFLGAVGISGALAILIYILIVAVWISALVFSIQVNRQEKGSGVAGDPSTSRVV